MELLQTLDESGTPPSSRIGDASNASMLVSRLIQADNLRSQYRARIKGLVDGNAPYSKQELVSKGMGTACNLNFRQAAGVINQYKTPYYDLLNEVPLLANIQTAFGTGTERGDWSQIISEEFHRVVTNWEDWDFVSQFHQFQMLVFGIGIVYFHDNIDWRPDAARTADVLVSDGSRSKVSELESCVILKDYNAANIYKYIRNGKAATDLGWNVKAVEKSIIESRFGTDPPTNANPYEWYQQKFKNADLFFGTYDCQSVKTGHVLVAEFDGKVSHHIVRSDRNTGEFLYTKLNRFESMGQVICPFFYDIGDGTWHSIRGLGYEIFPYCEMFNRLRGREVDAAMAASTILFQQATGDQITKAQLLTIVANGIVPAGLTYLPNNMGQNIQATSGVRRDMEQGLNQNIGLLQSVPGAPDPRKGQKQAMLEMQQDASLGKGNINRYYSCLDRLYFQMFNRLRNTAATKYKPGGIEATEFRDRCERRGVPKEALAVIDSVKAYRSVGAGSAVNALMITEAIMANAASYPEAGRDVAIRLWLSRLAGTPTMNAIMGETPKARINDDDWEATMENNALRTGGEVKITDAQSAVKHLTSHLDDMEAHVQEVQGAAQQNGMDMQALQDLFIHLDAAGPHCLEHLQSIQNDPIRAQDFQADYKRWQKLSRVHDQVKQQIGEMEQSQQPKQEETDPLERLKMLDYKSSPESVKAQIEMAAGTPRQGDLSVPAQSVRQKEAALALKAQQHQSTNAVNAVKLVQENTKIRQNGNKPVAAK